jgi:4-aminobutyrate aminotransferase-like enzyme
VARADGTYLWDADDNVFIDFLAGAGAASPEETDAFTRGSGMRRDDVLTNLTARGEQIAGRLAGLAHHPAVREVRGAGLTWEIELTAPGDGRSATGLAEDVRSRARQGGLIVEVGGRDDRVVRMLPPLDVTAEVVDIAMSILLHAIEGAYVGVLKAG